MPNMYIKPMLWYIAKLKYIDEELAKLPNVVLSTHGKRKVLIVKDENSRHEYSYKSQKWISLHTLAESRSSLISEQRKLIGELKANYGVIYENVKDRYYINRSGLTMCNSAFFASLRANSNSYGNNNEYRVKDDNHRSRFEMVGAQALEDLGIRFKYEPAVMLGNDLVTPDFALDFPEFNCCVLWELLGKLNETQYAYSRGSLLGNYSIHGYIIGRDVFFIGGTKTFMPNQNVLKLSLLSIIQMLCAICVIEVDS